MVDRVDGTFGNAIGCMPGMNEVKINAASNYPAIKIRALCVIVLMRILGIRE